MILPRNYFDSEAWKQKRVYSDAEAWLDIVRSARYDKDSCTAVINEKSVTWSRGEWPVSLRFLADRWQWSIRRVRSYLIKLCDHRLIAIRNSQVMNIIQVNDYNQYCGTANGTGNDTANGTANGTVAKASDGTVRGHDKTLTVTDIQSLKPSLSAQQNECNRQANGTVNGTANETGNDTANGTKKNSENDGQRGVEGGYLYATPYLFGTTRPAPGIVRSGLHLLWTAEPPQHDGCSQPLPPLAENTTTTAKCFIQ